MDMNTILQHLEMMHDWDADAIVDTLNISTEELLNVPEFLDRAMDWIEDNYE